MLALPLVLLAGAAAAQPGEPKLAAQPAKPTLKLGTKNLTPELAIKVRYPTAAEISPDGQWIVLAVKEANVDENKSSTHLYVLPAAGGDLRQLTFTGSSNSEPTWSPDGRRIAFTSARDDSAQLYILDLASGGEPRRVTELAGGASGPIWSPDGRHLAFVSEVWPDCRENACNKQKNDEKAKNKVKAKAYDDLFYRHWNAWDEGTRSHLFVVPVDGSAPPKDLTPGKVSVPPVALGEGRGYGFLGNDTLVYAANVDANLALSTNQDLFTVPLAGGAPKQLTTNKARDTNPVPTKDGRYVAYVSNVRPGFEADRNVVWIWDAKTNKHTSRTDSFDRSVAELAWMPGNAGLYLTAYDRGFEDLFSVGAEAGPVAELLDRKTVTTISVASNGTVAYVGSALDMPPEVFVYSPTTKQAKKVSHLNDGLMEGVRFGRTEELEVEVDGLKVHGHVVLPPDFKSGNRYPLVVMIHGGPQGAFIDSWHPRWNMQLFAARGYVVASPNFRGSVGYGQAYTDAVSKDWGGGPYRDVMAFTDALAKKPYIDDKWMCAAGASYGGYMINWIAGHTTRFRCLISHAGVFNLESMWGDTEELWFPEWEFGGTPWQARATYEKFSPHRYIENAKTPTLVIHGQLDYRVNLSQGLQMFTSLERLGVPSRFVYFPDEGHFVAKPQNWLYWYGEMFSWLGKYLR